MTIGRIPYLNFSLPPIPLSPIFHIFAPFFFSFPFSPSPSLASLCSVPSFLPSFFLTLRYAVPYDMSYSCLPHTTMHFLQVYCPEWGRRRLLLLLREGKMSRGTCVCTSLYTHAQWAKNGGRVVLLLYTAGKVRHFDHAWRKGKEGLCNSRKRKRRGDYGKRRERGWRRKEEGGDDGEGEGEGRRNLCRNTRSGWKERYVRYVRDRK